jgi:hypothetical protein
MVFFSLKSTLNIRQNEIQRLFGVIQNRRDRAIFLTAYRHGLQASQVGVSRVPFEPIDLKGYFAIFDVKKSVKTVLYGNGAVIGDSNFKKELLKTIRLCKIIDL